MLPVIQSRPLPASLTQIQTTCEPETSHRRKGNSMEEMRSSSRLIHFLGLITTQELYSIKLRYSVFLCFLLKNEHPDFTDNVLLITGFCTLKVGHSLWSGLLRPRAGIRSRRRNAASGMFIHCNPIIFKGFYKLRRHGKLQDRLMLQSRIRLGSLGIPFFYLRVEFWRPAPQYPRGDC